MNILVFEDRRAAELSPITLGRPAFLVSCGGSRLVEQLAQLGGGVTALVRPHLRDLLAADWPALADHDAWRETGAREHVLVANARLVPSVATREQLEELLGARQPVVVRSGDSIAAAVVRRDGLPDLADLDSDALIAALNDGESPEVVADMSLITHPHEVVKHHLDTMPDNLAARIGAGGYREIAPNVFAADQLGPHVATDTHNGPIVLEAGVEVGPFTLLEGPLYVERKVRIRERSSIQGPTSLGEGARVGGEVQASIIEPYSNKQHYGYLGHSYLGSWVNLGAGTCTSNLKHTYGPINVRRDGRPLATGMQFLGTIVGDYAKTAINTTVFTGITIGAASFVYGTVTADVPSFANYARSLGGATRIPPEVIRTMQSRMFARRGLLPRPADMALIESMWQLTEAERRHLPPGSDPPQF